MSERMIMPRKIYNALTPREIFETKFVLSDSCWNWIAGLNYEGYGVFTLKGKTHRAHRFSYQLYVGEIPKDKTLDHLCRNRKCVNPSHLEIVSKKENVLRGVGLSAENKRKTHCKHGHKFTPENTVLGFNQGNRPRRHCRICKTNFDKKRRGYGM